MQILRLYPVVLIPVAYLVSLRCRCAVGIYKAVAAEVVVRRVVRVVVATILEYGVALIVLGMQSLVYEVPDKASLVDRILAYEVPIFVHSATRVAHSVSILGHDERLLLRRVLAILLHTLRCVVHHGKDVGVRPLDGTLPMYGARRVVLVNPVLGSREVLRVGSLVAQRPVDNRRVVELVLHVVLVALKYRQCEYLLFGDSVFAVVEAVALLVSLCTNVQTILVAKVVEFGVVRIVACAHGVDVELLHKLDVLKHTLARHHVAAVGVYLVAVGALDVYRLAVYKQLRVLNLYLAETRAHRNSLYILVALLHRNHHLVEVRSLGSPLKWVLHVKLYGGINLGNVLAGLLLNLCGV